MTVCFRSIHAPAQDTIHCGRQMVAIRVCVLLDDALRPVGEHSILELRATLSALILFWGFAGTKLQMPLHTIN